MEKLPLDMGILMETPGFNFVDFMSCFATFDKPSYDLNEEQRKIRIKCLNMIIQLVVEDKISLKNMTPDTSNPDYVKNLVLRQLRLNLQEAECEKSIDMYLGIFLTVILIILTLGLGYYYYNKK